MATGVTAMKDPTRGGLASALHEMAAKSGVGIVLEGVPVPVNAEVRAAGELLGIDPLLVANEGKAVLGVRPDAAAACLRRCARIRSGCAPRSSGAASRNGRALSSSTPGLGGACSPSRRASFCRESAEGIW